MLLVNANRIDILTCMIPGCVAGEIGVAEAFYASHIMQYLQPAKLHLIDPWRFQDVPDYGMDANNTTDEEGDRRYNKVHEKFSKAINDGIVVMHRAVSHEIVDSFPDEYFDFLHIDAVHTYSGCLADLRTFERKVKRTGFITGRKSPAVTQRAQELKVEFVYLGQETKTAAFEGCLQKAGVREEETAYMGDDLPDMPVAKRAGLAVAVANAAPELKAVCHFVTNAKGGDGSAREIVELILKAQGRWEEAVPRALA